MLQLAQEQLYSLNSTKTLRIQQRTISTNQRYTHAEIKTKLTMENLP
jgi:hypothetical protein